MKRKYKFKKAQAGIPPIPKQKRYVDENEIFPGVNAPLQEQESWITPPAENMLVQGVDKGIIERPREQESYGYDGSIDRAYSNSRTRRYPVIGQNRYVDAFNVGATAVTGVANAIGNNKLKNQERFNTLDSLQPHYWENMEATGLNNLPMYTQAGGGPSAHKAKEMLKDGTANGKKLTGKQKRYFGWIAGGKKQTGGSIVDYLDHNGTNSSFDARKSYFSDYFGGEKYKGTAEQNLRLLKTIDKDKGNFFGSSGDTLPNSAPASSKSAVVIKDARKVGKQVGNAPFNVTLPASPKDRKLESGIIEDKGSGKGYIIKNGKKVKEFNILTGQNVMGERNDYGMSQLESNPNLRATSSGSYFMNYDNDIYGMPGYDMQPIEAFGQPAPKAVGLAMHRTYPEERAYRSQFYGTNDTGKSYGCTNVEDCTMKNLILPTFGQRGDTAIVVNSRRPEGKETLKKYGIKRTGGGCDDCMKQTGGQMQVRRLQPTEMQQWNQFLDFVKDKGYEGSADLNKKNKNLGSSLFQEFKSANPNVSINYDIVPSVQAEMQVLRDSTQAFAKRKNMANADTMMNDVSPVDNWFGSKTSQFRFPDATLVTQRNNQTIGQQNLGLVAGNLQATGAGPTGKSIPKGVKVETFYDADGKPSGQGYADPATGDLVQLKYGGKKGKKWSYQAGGDIPVVNGLPDEMAQFANVEAEAGEIAQMADGRMVKVSDSANTHEQGGEALPNVSAVLEDTSDKRKDKASKALRITPKEADSKFGIKIKRPVSHAKLFEAGVKKIEKKEKEYTRAKKNANLKEEVDKSLANSIELNQKFQSIMEQPEDLFADIFDHQESVKAELGINDDGSMGKYGGKYGLRKAQAGIGTYSGGRTPAGRTTPTGNSNAFNFPGGLDAFKKAWAPILDLDKYQTVEQAQAAAYEYLAKNQPDVAESIWQNQGLTAKGRQMLDPKGRAYNPGFAGVANQIFDSNGRVKPGIKLTPEQLAAIGPAYADNMLGIRAVTPSQFTTTTDEGYPNTAAPAPAPTAGPMPNTGVNINPRFRQQPANDFYEPTYWSDIAAPGIALADSMRRDPELYNSVEANQLRLKLLDPTASLNANQADFNAVTESLSNMNVGSGAAAGNLANLAGRKYSANNQVLSQYDNANVGIKNEEIKYNTGVRDRQSIYDNQTRREYDRNVKLAREAQRQQYLTSVTDLSRVDQLKRRQNNSGNLIQKLSPAYDQHGNYNGYQYLPTLPPELGIASAIGDPLPTAAKRKSKTSTTTTFRTADGRVIKTTNQQ